MVELTILCHPCTPVAPMELGGWLQDQVDRLQSSAPELIVRLSRLSQGLPDSEIVGGWLVELELAEESWDSGQLSDVLADVLTDMRFLGMQPRLMLPLGISNLTSALGKAFSEPQPLEVRTGDASSLTSRAPKERERSAADRY